ncbi:hypothetical protein C8J56DRAFT_1157642 [Mycena floridula]|nr:hypothetical protein C8J56DRAFT_1157642 [Mycena floridula]
MFHPRDVPERDVDEDEELDWFRSLLIPASWSLPAICILVLSLQAQAATIGTREESSPVVFSAIPDGLVTCGSTRVDWTYTGPANISMMLMVTDELNEVSLQTLITVDADDDSFLWSPIRIAPGSYRVRAIIGQTNAISSLFSVATGTDSACLTDQNPSFKQPSSSNGTVIGLAAALGGCAAFLIAVLTIRWFCMRRRERKRQRQLVIPVQEQLTTLAGSKSARKTTRQTSSRDVSSIESLPYRSDETFVTLPGLTR